MTKNGVISEKLVKLYRLKMMGTHGKINAIWWNIEINLQKFSDMWYEFIANLQKFHSRRLNRIENIQKSFFGGDTFLKQLVDWG